MTMPVSQNELALFQLLERAHQLHHEREASLPRTQREYLASRLSTAWYLQSQLNAQSDAIHLQLLAVFSEMGNALCIKGELILALQAFVAGDYGTFEVHLTYAEQWHQRDLEDTPSDKKPFCKSPST
ncbi:MAG: hypothetical protein AAB445_04790 [Patescibacteria group bacterium]